MVNLIVLAILGAPAHASAYYFLDTGTRAMARGGAFVAGVDDLSAQYYNPAGLVRLERPQAYVNFSMVDQAVKFTRIDYDDEGSVAQQYDPSENIGPPMQIPAFAVAHHFGLKNTMFAFGMYPPFAPDMQYPTDGAQRYTLIDSLVWQIYGGPSVAHRFSFAPWLTVGAGFIWTLVRAEEQLAVSICVDGKNADKCPEGTDPAKNDVTVQMKVLDPWRFMFNAGLLIEPKPWLSIGFSMLPPLKVHGEGTLEATFGKDHWLVTDPYNALDGRSFTDDEITLLLTMPLILRGGIAVRPVKGLEVEAASVFQRWSMTEEVRITDVNLVLKHKPDSLLTDDVVITNDVVLPADYVDTFSFRLGGDYDINTWLTVRGGAFWEGSAIPAETQGVALVDGNKWGYGAGGTWRHKNRLALDLGFNQSWINETDIRTTTVRRLEVPVNFAEVQNGEDLPIVDGAIVGTGLFSSHLTMVSAGATVFFGKPAGG